MAVLDTDDDRLVEAHDRAVRVALAEIGTQAATRVRADGKNEDRITGNMIVACLPSRFQPPSRSPAPYPLRRGEHDLRRRGAKVEGVAGGRHLNRRACAYRKSIATSSRMKSRPSVTKSKTGRTDSKSKASRKSSSRSSAGKQGAGSRRRRVHQENTGANRPTTKSPFSFVIPARIN